MTAAVSPPAPGPQAPRERWAKWIVIALLAYWAAYALVAPVTNYDSQVYNLARLSIAQAGGLFGNHAWNSVRQVVFPWTFDAIHLPFLFLGWGYCLPSFACFVGLLIIVYRLVTGERPAWQAWWCCLSLLALPTLVFQSLCTKNDVAVVFAVACWFYAWTLWRREGRSFYLLLMALALGFAAGAKTSGLPYFGLLGAFTFWQLRSDRWQAARFAGWMALFFVLFGSVEIYLNNELVYHAPLGPAPFIEENKNRDGLAGGVANFIRYSFGDMSAGIDAANPDSPVAGWLASSCRQFLRFTGLSNVGYRGGFGDNDDSLRFLKLGLDSESDYGPVGALALIAGLVFVLARRRSDPIWQLAAGGLAALALTSYTVAWMMWNARFLVLSFCLLTLALTLWVGQLRPTGAGRFVRSAFFLLMVYSAIVYPLHSFNKRPADLWQALSHRSAYELRERLSMLQIVEDLRARAKAIGPSELLLDAGSDSWALCILELRHLHVVPAPVIDLKTLTLASRSGGAGARPVYVLMENMPVPPEVEPALTLLENYNEVNSALYEWQPPGARTTNAAPGTAKSSIGRTSLATNLIFFDPKTWFDQEHDAADAWVWAKGPASITVMNPDATPRDVRLRFALSALTDRTVRLLGPDGAVLSSTAALALRRTDAVPISLHLAPGKTTLRFESDQPPVAPPGDPRRLDFRLFNLKMDAPK
jgi:hypothetical protein